MHVNEKERRTWIHKRALCWGYADILSSDHLFAPRAARLLHCTARLVPNWHDHSSEWRLRPRYACGVPFCPSCGGRLHRQQYAYLRTLPLLLARYSTAQLLAITCTVAHCPVHYSRLWSKQITQGFDRLLRRRLLSGQIAYARSVEFTRSRDGKAHPHLHSLLVLPGDNAG